MFLCLSYRIALIPFTSVAWCMRCDLLHAPFYPYTRNMKKILLKKAHSSHYCHILLETDFVFLSSILFSTNIFLLLLFPIVLHMNGTCRNSKLSANTISAALSSHQNGNVSIPCLLVYTAHYMLHCVCVCAIRCINSSMLILF